jgi:hypothetical protein
MADRPTLPGLVPTMPPTPAQRAAAQAYRETMREVRRLGLKDEPQPPDVEEASLALHQNLQYVWGWDRGYFRKKGGAGYRHGYTGSRDYDDDRDDHVALLVPYLSTFQYGDDSKDEHTTGGCNGLDVAAMLILIQLYPRALHRLILPADHRQVDLDAVEALREWGRVEGHRAEILQCAEGTDYRHRDTEIVRYSEMLHCFPYVRLEKPHSGTWMTHNIAVKAGLPVNVITLPA